MKTFNNELLVHRNETFTIDKIIQNVDGSPFIISSKLSNPFFLITVSSTRYKQEKRYIKNWWLDLKSGEDILPRFKYTQAIDLKSCKTSGGQIIAEDFDDIETLIETTDSEGKSHYWVIYSNDDDVFFEVGDAVFYVEKDDGSRIYKYCVPGDPYRVGNTTIIPAVWKEYICRIVMPFEQKDTAEWVEQTYIYTINLVSGRDTLSTVTDWYITVFEQAPPTEYTKYDIYEKLKESHFDFPENFRINAGLYKYDYLIPILASTKITVEADLNGKLFTL